jgi:hypothetical protein
MRARAFRGAAALVLRLGGASSLLVACATIGSDGLGDVGLPNAGVGPFRRLVSGEVPGIAPYVLEGEGAYREPAVLSDGEGTRVWLYAAATSTGRDGIAAGPVIVRTSAKDARSFVGSGFGPGRGTALALAPSLPWEGGVVGSPFVLRSEGRVLLFYAARDGIGLATADAPEGPFVKRDTPVLAAPDTRGSGWETGAPRAPTAYVEGRTLHLFYASSGAIGEAVADVTSLAFRRVDADPRTPELDPVLGRSASVDPRTLAPGEKPPFDELAVDDPCVSARESPAGRTVVRVLYTGSSTGSTRATAIGFAARFGHEGPFEKQSLPVYAAKSTERAPALLDLGARSYLYFTEPRASDGREGIGAGFAPGNVDPGPLEASE